MPFLVVIAVAMAIVLGSFFFGFWGWAGPIVPGVGMGVLALFHAHVRRFRSTLAYFGSGPLAPTGDRLYVPPRTARPE